MSEVLSGEFDIEDEFICLKLIEADSWKNANNPIKCNIINYFNEYLAARYKDPDNVNVVFTDAGNDPQGRKDEKNFLLEKYRTTDPSQYLSVVFSVSVNEEKFHMCCTLEKEITFKKGQSPSSISGNTSDVIFFARTFSMGHDAYKFESSLHRDHFLAIKEENGRRILHLKKPSDVVDEGVKFTLHNNG